MSFQRVRCGNEAVESALLSATKVKLTSPYGSVIWSSRLRILSVFENRCFLLVVKIASGRLSSVSVCRVLEIEIRVCMLQTPSAGLDRYVFASNGHENR